jgi:cobalt/nickel transport system permease protein
MHVGLLDSYQPRRSPVHRLPARTKLVAALTVILCLISLPRGWDKTGVVALAGATLLLLVTAARSELSPAFLLRRLLLLEPFVLGVAALSLWQPHGGEVFWHTVMRSTLCLATLVLLAATTPFSEIVRVLRSWRVPALLLTTLTLMDRYLFVLVEESSRMQRARASRTFATHSRFRVWQSLAATLGELFVRSVGRAARIYDAMCARGWETSAPPKA